MMRQLYSHLCVAVDTEPFYADLVRQYSRAHFPGGADERRRVRQEIEEKNSGHESVVGSTRLSVWQGLSTNRVRL
jgi:hypothetical protein